MNKVKMIRKQKGLTQKDLATKSSIPLATIKSLEKDSTDLHRCIYDTLDKIACALGVKVKDLL